MEEKQKNSVLITGATGGFGREFACQLEKKGYRLLLHGRDHARMQLTLGALHRPADHTCLYADLSTQTGCERLIAQARRHAHLTGLVNNAGFGVWGGFEQLEFKPQIEVLQTNLLAPITLAHALLPILIRNHGFMINVSSLAGETPLPHMSTYSAAKAGLSFWSEALRMEARSQVRIVTLAPGPSPTGFRDVSGMPRGKGVIFRANASSIIQQALAQLDRGGGCCVPFPRHRLLWLVQKLTPRSIALPLMRRFLSSRG